MSCMRVKQSRLTSLCALQCRADVLELGLSCRSHGNAEFKVNALAVGLHS